MFKFEDTKDGKWYKISDVIKRFVDKYYNRDGFMAYLPCLSILSGDTYKEKVDVVMKVRRKFMEKCKVSLDSLVEFEKELGINFALREQAEKAFGEKDQERFTAVLLYFRKRSEKPPEDFIAELTPQN